MGSKDRCEEARRDRPPRRLSCRLRCDPIITLRNGHGQAQVERIERQGEIAFTCRYGVTERSVYGPEAVTQTSAQKTARSHDRRHEQTVSLQHLLFRLDDALLSSFYHTSAQHTLPWTCSGQKSRLSCRSDSRSVAPRLVHRKCVDQPRQVHVQRRSRRKTRRLFHLSNEKLFTPSPYQVTPSSAWTLESSHASAASVTVSIEPFTLTIARSEYM